MRVPNKTPKKQHVPTKVEPIPVVNISELKVSTNVDIPKSLTDSIAGIYDTQNKIVELHASNKEQKPLEMEVPERLEEMFSLMFNSMSESQQEMLEQLINANNKFAQQPDIIVKPQINIEDRYKKFHVSIQRDENLVLKSFNIEEIKLDDD